MPRPKSLLKSVTVDIAQRAHNCQHVPSHRVHTGDKRLKLAKERTHEHFCVECAVQMIDADIDKLTKLKMQLVDIE